MYQYRQRRTRVGRKIKLPKFFDRFKSRRAIVYSLIFLVILIPAMFFWFSRGLPTPGTLVYPKFSDATRIYDRNGELLYSVYEDQNRTYVTLDKIPEDLRNATISIEDKDFYKNQGFSVNGYLRALKDALLFRGVTGASTITQQLVKNVLLSDERSVSRKVREFILAIQVTNRFSKDEILEMYLNNISYGSAAVGVEAASQIYFGKNVDELNLAQSAFLAGLPQSPTRYSPFSGNDYYIGRTEAVLKQMRENGNITKLEEKEALEEIKKYKFSKKETQIKAPHFVLYVKQILEEQYGEQYVTTGGLQVTTTLDYKIQKEAEKIVEEEVKELKQYRANNAGALITDPKTGEILAMVGSHDYYDEEGEGNFNVVTQANRQPGSSLKPIIYAAALQKGFTPSSFLMDVSTEFPTNDPNQPIYKPVNYSGKFYGPMQLRFALANSINIVAVKLLALVGVKDAMQLAYDMGVENWQPTNENMQNVGLSLVLGGRETTLKDIVTSYGVFANKGEKKELYSIQKVTDFKNKKLFEHKDTDGVKVLSEEISFLISHILLDNAARSMEFGANSLLRIPNKTVAVKTGTTDQKRDNWTIGYTPSYVVGVWVGNNDNSPMNPNIASGLTGASSIWHELMLLVLKDEKNEEFDIPGNVHAIQIDSLFGGLPFELASRSEYFVKGSEPKEISKVYKDGFYVVKEVDPVSTDGKNRWQEGIDSWIVANRKDDPKWNPPDGVKNPGSSNPDNNNSDNNSDQNNNQPTPTQAAAPTEAPSPLPSPSPTP